ncbi:hypothetical protein ACG91D_21190 [Acinetobacter guillouiae]|uniref:hypothetical protein n=1 Tax=Acinetobacter guillouiae TaxID=106649 RepID=UPI003AF594FB
MGKLLFTTIIIGLLTGCNTLQGSKQPEWPWIGVGSQTGVANLSCKSDACDKKDAVESFLRASNYCVAIYDQYRSDISNVKGIKGGIGILGAILGIAGTTTSGTSAKFLSGFSGASNAFQVSTTEMFSATATFASLTSIQELVGKYNEAVLKNIEDNKFDHAVFNSIKLAGECKYALSVIQTKMVNSVVTPSQEQQSKNEVTNLDEQIKELKNQINKISSTKDKEKLLFETDKLIQSSPKISTPSLLNNTQLPIQ